MRAPSDWLSFLHALVDDDPHLLTRWLAKSPLDVADIQWLWRQRLALYLYHLLHERDQFGLLSAEVVALLRKGYQSIAIRDVVQHAETSQVLEALNLVQIDTVLLKGAALANTVYPTARCRFRSDLDIWIQDCRFDEVVEALAPLGYTVGDKMGRPWAMRNHLGGEVELVKSLGTIAHVVDVQSPAFHGEWVRNLTQIDHDGIWARRRPLTIDAQPTAAMAAEDALIHLALHAAINHQFAIWLEAFLDMHLLIKRTPQLDWQAIAQRGETWGLKSVLGSVLHVLSTLYGTPVPAALLERLAASATRQRFFALLDPPSWLLRNRTHGAKYSHRRFLIQLALIDRPRDGIRLMRHTLFPDAEWLRLRYDATTTRQLWNER
ncbi:MAG: nucleotidyltransferase family protein, partial [Anaerolineales bacterium]|nr:nucleotidyltransferase family protein [Anaerolineales bacterium]